MKVTRFTKGVLDFMFYAGILIVLSLPVSLKILGDYFPEYRQFYVVLFFFCFCPVSLRF